MKRRFQHNWKYVNFAKLCACLSNPTRIAILDRIAKSETCITGDFIDMGEITRMTTSENIKQLAKMGLINGSFSKRTLSYCINYKKLEELKAVMDEVYNSLIINKDKVNPSNKPCSAENETLVEENV